MTVFCGLSNLKTVATKKIQAYPTSGMETADLTYPNNSRSVSVKLGITFAQSPTTP